MSWCRSIFCPHNSSQSKTNVQTRLNISPFARTCDWYGICERSAAALASAMLMNVSIVDDDDESIATAIFNKNKIRRKRENKSIARY